MRLELGIAMRCLTQSLKAHRKDAFLARANHLTGDSELLEAVEPCT